MNHNTARPHELERALQAMSTDVAFPATPALAQTVTERIAATPATVERRPWRRLWRSPRLVTALATVLLLASALVFSGGARRAVADLLGVIGIEISYGEVDLPEHREEIDELRLGEQVEPVEAAERAGFEVRGPGAFEDPVRVFFDDSIGASGIVSTVGVVEGTADLVLINEFVASLHEPLLDKVAAHDTTIRIVTYPGIEFYWLSGAAHEVSYIDPDGTLRPRTQRLAGNVLLWQAGEITYRIEGPPTLKQAVDIAERMGFR